MNEANNVVAISNIEPQGKALDRFLGHSIHHLRLQNGLTLAEVSEKQGLVKACSVKLRMASPRPAWKP